MKQKLIFIRTCYYFGVVADFIAAIPLIFPLYIFAYILAGKIETDQ